MSIVARKQPSPKGSTWLYWTGKEWSAKRGEAMAYPARAAALAVHAELLKQQTWPAGGNPLVIDKD